MINILLIGIQDTPLLAYNASACPRAGEIINLWGTRYIVSTVEWSLGEEDAVPEAKVFIRSIR